MLYEDLHRRFGNHVSQRLRLELTPSEFDDIGLEDLADWLEERATIAHQAYRSLLNNPLASTEQDTQLAGEACKKWRDAEDLAYLIAIAGDDSRDAQAS